MVTNAPKHILIAPLDWGLGHTTRCVPIIRHILRLGHVPVVAGNLSQKHFIEKIFAGIDFIHLDGYNITYSKWNRWMQSGLLSQLPRIRKTIQKEHKWLQHIVATRNIDGIISDNRYGLFHQHIPSVILTHQLQVLTGLGAFADRIVQRVHYGFLKRFGATWVVDAEGAPNLGGKLSHTTAMPTNPRYIGLLSRFDSALPVKPSIDHSSGPLLILLSGPEPQRATLSAILWQQALAHNGHIVFIDGCEQAIPPATIPAHISYHRRIAGVELEAMLQNASMVICRSGYSSLMDLVALGKPAIVIPTPGQTEQEYLASHLHEQQVFLSARQQGFDLARTLKLAETFPFLVPDLRSTYDGYKSTLEQWLDKL